LQYGIWIKALGALFDMTQSKKSTSTFKANTLLSNKRKFIPDPLLNKRGLREFKKLVIKEK
jgi:hypothetical protein